jgi:hypothetical protein
MSATEGAKPTPAYKKALTSFQVYKVELYNVSLQTGISFAEEDENTSYSYAAETEIFSTGGEFFVGYTTVGVEKQVEDTREFALQAVYFFMLEEVPKLGKEASIELGKYVGKHLIWPRFQILFGFMNAQSGRRMPELPYAPANITAKVID